MIKSEVTPMKKMLCSNVSVKSNWRHRTAGPNSLSNETLHPLFHCGLSTASISVPEIGMPSCNPGRDQFLGEKTTLKDPLCKEILLPIDNSTQLGRIWKCRVLRDQIFKSEGLSML